MSCDECSSVAEFSIEVTEYGPRKDLCPECAVMMIVENSEKGSDLIPKRNSGEGECDCSEIATEGLRKALRTHKVNQ